MAKTKSIEGLKKMTLCFNFVKFINWKKIEKKLMTEGQGETEFEEGNVKERMGYNLEWKMPILCEVTIWSPLLQDDTFGHLFIYVLICIGQKTSLIKILEKKTAGTVRLWNSKIVHQVKPENCVQKKSKIAHWE